MDPRSKTVNPPHMICYWCEGATVAHESGLCPKCRNLASMARALRRRQEMLGTKPFTVLKGKKTVFFELYVLPKLINKQITLEYELHQVSPRLAGLRREPTQWRPTPPTMEEEILSTLLRDCTLTPSYDEPEIVIRSYS